jgi:hypothetical protein
MQKNEIPAGKSFRMFSLAILNNQLCAAQAQKRERESRDFCQEVKRSNNAPVCSSRTGNIPGVFFTRILSHIVENSL